MNEDMSKVNTQYEVSAEEPSVDLKFTATAHSAAFARKHLRQILKKWHPGCSIAGEELLLAIGEAISNAWRHGCNGKPLSIRLTVSWNAETKEVTATVYDPGPGFDYSPPVQPSFKENLSCGLFLMSSIADSISYEHQDEWFVCRMVKRL
jgi:anti-sigma regulatory factor (Ser/Thr protein kinase)